jgi:CRISPR-associated exonuclease Cas4
VAEICSKIECVEKNKQDKKIHIVELDENDIVIKEKQYEDIMCFLTSSNPPQPVFEKKCNRCAYHDYCFI